MANLVEDGLSQATEHARPSRSLSGHRSLNGLRHRASKEHIRLQEAKPSERLRAALERALAGDPGPRVLLREELRRAEVEAAALAEIIAAAHEALETPALSPRGQGGVEESQIYSPLQEASSYAESPRREKKNPRMRAAEAVVPPVASRSEKSSPSSSVEAPGPTQLRRTEAPEVCSTIESAATGERSADLDHQVDAWLQQERVKNMKQPYNCQTPGSSVSGGGESLLYRESYARMEVESEAKSQASSDVFLGSGMGDSLLYKEAKARHMHRNQKLDELRLDEQKSDAANSAANEAQLRRSQAQQRALCEVQRLVQEVQRSNGALGIEDLRTARNELSVAIDAAKRYGASEVSLRPPELLRRRIHNAIEDLKGSLRVYCCVRPMNDKEVEHGDSQVVTRIDDRTVQVQNLWEKSAFKFDAVFLPSKPPEVWKDCRDLMQSAIDGHNVTIFAYGQTSAGKTYTLFGEGAQPGLAPRMIHEIYEIMRKQSGRYAHTIIASMLELYRNDLVDLLAKDSPSPRTAEGSERTKKLSVRADKHGAVHIENLTEEACADSRELAELLERGHEQRTTRSTAMNANSSRSHLIFTIRIGQVNLETGEELRGKIMICDLAGSERLGKAMVSGVAAKEAIEINRSLTALGDVVAAIRQGHKQVPYRNHKLTQLMQDAFTQSSKVLMFVNCSPASSNVEETLMSLRYATRAKKIKTAAARARRASEPLLTGVKPCRDG